MGSRTFAVVIVVSVLALTRLAAAQQPADQTDFDSKHLQGTWVLQSIDGQQPESARSIRFEKDQVAGLFLDEQKNPLTLKYRLLPDRKIKGLDAGPFPAEYQGLVIHGVYQIDGDVLKLAFQPKLDDRNPPPGYDLKERRPTSLDPQLVKVEIWRRVKEEQAE